MGYCLVTILLFTFAVVFGLDLDVSIYLIMAAASAGILWRLRDFRDSTLDHGYWPRFHSLPVLIGLGAACIMVNGGIDYLPTTNDEFTSWIGNSRFIHFAGNFDTIKDRAHLPGYVPGWRLLLLAPWQILGDPATGLSASAAFVIHVAVASVFFDFCLFWFIAKGNVDKRTGLALAWFCLFLFLAAEGMGRLWPLYLLIEPPQIFSYAAVFIIVLLAELAPLETRGLWWRGGLVLAGAVLFKFAAITLVPALAFVAAQPLIRKSNWRSNRIREIAIRGLQLVAPALIVFLVWTALRPASPSCFGSPESILSFEFSGRDPAELAGRFTESLFGYVASYKVVLTVAATAGFAMAGLRRSGYIAVAGFGVFVFTYFTLLYWFYLVCWEDYGYQTLISLERYARVPIQVFHAVGLLLLVLLGFERFTKAEIPWAGSRRMSRTAVVAIIMATILLGGWQIRQVYRSVVDGTDRSIWPADPRIGEMQDAARFILNSGNVAAEGQPRLLIIDQGGDHTPTIYAKYFSMTSKPEGPHLRFGIHPRVSWSTNPVNVWQVRSSKEKATVEFRDADVIWPLSVDPWVLDILTRMGVPDLCLTGILGKALVKSIDGPSHTWSCHPKRSSQYER